MKTYRLSKSRFQTGLQCEKALWLTANARELADDISETQQHVFDTGTAVGELARERFADGVLVAEDHTQSAQALVTTQRLLAESPPAIFEAALEHEGVFVRPDVLVRVSENLWDLYEVKSSTKVKPENITDVAVQTWVLEGAGLPIRRAHLMHLNRDYVYDGGNYDLDRLFTAEDVTEDARAFMPAVPGHVRSMLSMLAGPEPEVRIGKQCSSPYTCGFHGHCHSFLPERPVTKLPRIGEALLSGLLDAGIHAIDDVPLDFPGLSSSQREICEIVRSGEPRTVGDLARSLAQLGLPLHFLDFETFASALPLYAGMRPWRAVPFQWSLHTMREDGTMVHQEFLHEADGDPRRTFTETLLKALGDEGKIVVYSSFENSRLNELAEAYPDLATDIAAVQARFVDLLAVVRKHVRHPDTLGSNSIKAVLPALVDDLSYEGLAIADGNVASVRYLQFATGRLGADEAAELFGDLKAYCGTDTLAMVRLWEVLREQAGLGV